MPVPELEPVRYRSTGPVRPVKKIYRSGPTGKPAGHKLFSNRWNSGENRLKTGETMLKFSEKKTFTENGSTYEIVYEHMSNTFILLNLFKENLRTNDSNIMFWTLFLGILTEKHEILLFIVKNRVKKEDFSKLSTGEILVSTGPVPALNPTGSYSRNDSPGR